MAKTKEELKQLKQEYESLQNKLSELTQQELDLVTGGKKLQDESLSRVKEMRTGGDIYIG